MRKPSFLIAAFAFISAPALADQSESVFRDALAYTVQIRTTVRVPFGDDDKGSSRGAGFVVDAARGWVMTNAHVVSRSPSRVEISFKDRPYADAKKVYVDPLLDVAIVEIRREEGVPLIAAKLECEAVPSVGHPVGAFGHPWNLRYTGTRGIVSGATSTTSTVMLQTDAPINAGNSGGPLISLESARVVGINTASRTNSQNTNFAVEMKHACAILTLLQKGIDPSPPELRLAFLADANEERTLKVAKNYDASGRLPLLPGDTVLGIVGERTKLANETELAHALRGRLNAFALRVLRDGREVAVQGSAAPKPNVLAERGLLVTGMLFSSVWFPDASESRIGPLMVHHVESGSEGQAAGIHFKDILEAVNGQPVASLDDLRSRIDAAAGKIVFTFRRFGGKEQLFTFLERTLEVKGAEWIAERNAVRLALAASAPK